MLFAWQTVLYSTKSMTSISVCSVFFSLDRWSTYAVHQACNVAMLFLLIISARGCPEVPEYVMGSYFANNYTIVSLLKLLFCGNAIPIGCHRTLACRLVMILILQGTFSYGNGAKLEHIVISWQNILHFHFFYHQNLRITDWSWYNKCTVSTCWHKEFF